MEAWWTSLSGAEHVFLIIAIVSTLILVLQMLMNLLGLAGHDADVTLVTHDIPLPETAEPGDMTGHSTGLGLISARTITAFFVGMGWAGVVAFGYHLPLPAVILASFVVGLVFMFTVFYLMRAIFGLSASGNIDYRNAVGQSGRVYLPIPANKAGVGQIQVVVQGRLREIAAVTDGAEALSSGTPVKVVNINGTSTLLVRKEG